jgi:hypothetical protein
VAAIKADVMEFPECGTLRADWQDRGIDIAGDRDCAAVFLDELTIV